MESGLPFPTHAYLHFAMKTNFHSFPTGEELRAAVDEWQAKRATEAAPALAIGGFLDGSHPVVDAYELKARPALAQVLLSICVYLVEKVIQLVSILLGGEKRLCILWSTKLVTQSLQALLAAQQLLPDLILSLFMYRSGWRTCCSGCGCWWTPQPPPAPPSSCPTCGCVQALFPPRGAPMSSRDLFLITW